MPTPLPEPPADADGFDAALREELRARAQMPEAATQTSGEDAARLAPEIEDELARLKPEEGGERIGPYKLLQQIGEGGFGVVWMADQEQPVRRRVALKIIKLGMDTKEVIARFEQERQALAMMEHPNIARVFDAGATQYGRPFFVMELVRGMRITDYCDLQQLSTPERLALFIQVCHAVQHAHQKGVIHRDLKPSNILVTMNDGEAVPKVIDFGVAKAIQGRLTEATLFTQFEQMVGTPLYMSPEQAELTSLDVDTRSDIYSLGVLLYELLTGRTPIDRATMGGAGLDEIRRLIREVDPPRPSARVRTLDGGELTSTAKRRHAEPAKLPGLLRGDLDWIVMKCLEKDRQRRYDTANGLARDLQRHLANEVVAARPPTAAYRLGRLIRRHKLAFAASAAIALSLLIGLASSLWQAVRAQHEAARAKTAEAQAVATLDELRASAPAFAAQARALASKERFAEAVEKLDYAIKLRPDVADYVLTKADLLQCQLKFAEAAAAYRAALNLAPDNARAQSNAALCDKLQAEFAAQSKVTRESLVQLFTRMTAEHRSAAELLAVGRMVGEEKKLVIDYWIERLKDLPVPPANPIEKRLTMADDGKLALDLSETPIADLAPLEGMPLGVLNLAACTTLADFRPLSALPLRTLDLSRTTIADLAPLATIGTLKELELKFTRVRDLSALRALPLERLGLQACTVADLEPLRGLPLRKLSLRNTEASDLTPLAGLPLEHLDCSAIPATDCGPLSGMPLKTLILQLSRVRDLSFLRGMPLKTLNLHACLLARGFGVLPELKELEILVLPDMAWSWPKEEFTALGALREHPTLRQIEFGITMDGQVPSTTQSTAGFWKRWDREVQPVLALHESGVKFSTDRTVDRALSVTIEDPAFADLSVFRGANLGSLTLKGTNVRDLKPLAGLPLKSIGLRRVPVIDLSPLGELALDDLTVHEMNVTDVSFLRRAPLCTSLEKLRLEKLNVADFSPVAACKALMLFSAWESSLADLAPLRGLQLRELYLQGSRVRDLSALAGMPLERLFLDRVAVTDLTPLLKVPTLKDAILPENAQEIAALRKLPNLQRVSFSYDEKVGGPSMTALEFWSSLSARSGSTAAPGAKGR